MPSVLRGIWIVAFLLVGWVMSMVLGIEPVRANDLKDQELSDLVRRAYIYSFPVYEMYQF